VTKYAVKYQIFACVFREFICQVDQFCQN